jgi:hypothetical protein
MTTLTAMKTRIAQEVRRKAYADVGTVFAQAIDDAINTAIFAYQDERFHFNERRDVTFPTVADQEFYDSDDLAAIGNLVKIDYVKLIVGTTVFNLTPDFPAEIEGAASDSTSTGQPSWFVYYGRQLRFYPIPADVWTIRLAGLFKLAAPATDGEAGNFWMTDAERLIRSRAKYELALHVLRDTELAQTMASAVTEALDQLKRWTNKLTQGNNGRVRAMHC